ncbi:VOC family protein [Desertihabitans aurantiacus]|uniref:VOC family protein n=1 Tax=Desertihabitans aurantiacus TaxID=2282477 RepID=UPI000DF82089|nr:VOC family protein [Desertihabitans aurantiacus]
MSGPLRGLAQVNLAVEDVAAARDWYARFLGVEPYFQRPDADQPAYVEFRIGDAEDELGLIDRRYLPEPWTSATGGVVARWHVDDLPGTVQRLLDLGARPFEPVVEREAGFATASVIDPFGHVLGLIHSPHYRERADGPSAG